MRTAERILGSRLWYRHALLMSGAVGRDEFIGKFDCFASRQSGYGIDPRGPAGWMAGKTTVSMGTAHLVESQIAGTKYVLALATLLTPKDLSAPGARRAVRELYDERPDGRYLWILPSISAPAASARENLAYSWEDSIALASRGDFFGFLAVLALLRESIARNDYQRSSELSRRLYSMLPTVCALDWVRPDVDLLVQCIEDMMVGVRWLWSHVTVDWRAFRTQVSNPIAWEGQPPWVLVGSDTAQPELSQLAPRPVPLLDGGLPLRPWVRDTQVSEPALARGRSSGQHIGWFNRIIGSQSH